MLIFEKNNFKTKIKYFIKHRSSINLIRYDMGNLCRVRVGMSPQGFAIAYTFDWDFCLVFKYN